MPDLPGLPPRRVPPPMEPPAGSVERVVRRGDARRRRVAVSAASAFGLAAVATAAVLRLPGTPADVVVGADDPPGPAASATITEPPQPVGMRRETTAYDGSCADRAGRRTAHGWCVDSVGATSGSAGRPVTLAVELCRLPGYGDGIAEFWTSQEADFTVSTRGSAPREVWRWSRGRAFEEATHPMRVAEGRCARWSVEWTVRGDDGRPLARGTYALLPEVVAEGLAGPAYEAGRSFVFTVN